MPDVILNHLVVVSDVFGMLGGFGRRTPIHQILSEKWVQNVGVDAVEEQVIEAGVHLQSQTLPLLRNFIFSLHSCFQDRQIDADKVVGHAAFGKVVFLFYFHLVFRMFVPLGFRIRDSLLWQLIVLEAQHQLGQVLLQLLPIKVSTREIREKLSS